MDNLKKQLIVYHKVVCKYTEDKPDKDFLLFIKDIEDEDMNSAVEISKKINNDFENILKKDEEKIEGGGIGWIAMGVGAATLYVLYNLVRDGYNRRRYRGRVDSRVARERAYPSDYQQGPHSPGYGAISSRPGHSHPHRHLYPGRYSSRNYEAGNYDNHHIYPGITSFTTAEREQDSD